jgi:hypothetical protein
MLLQWVVLPLWHRSCCITATRHFTAAACHCCKHGIQSSSRNQGGECTTAHQQCRSNLTLGMPAQSRSNLTLGMPAQSRLNLTLGMPAQSRSNLTLGMPAQSRSNLTLGMPAQSPPCYTAGAEAVSLTCPAPSSTASPYWW